ncbi:MAG: hypothetical protein WC760_07505 [Bacteroidia bacterium]|jgi:hypothetical protein
MKRFIVGLFGLSCWSLFAQQTDTSVLFKELLRIPLSAKMLETDPMGNSYPVSPTNQVYKLDKNGKILSTLNYKYEGNITGLDPSNPLEIYVFYRELNKVVYLDNNLAFRGETLLSVFGITQASTVARAYDNSIWVFDYSDLQLKKIDKDGQNPQSSGNILQFTKSKQFAPLQIREDGRQVMVNDTMNGILLFDLFCNYQRTLPITGAVFFRSIGSHLFYLKQGQLHQYNRISAVDSELSLPGDPGWISLDITADKLYMLYPGMLVIYTY